MARYTGASCRMCRRENVKLFLKGERCHTDKCSFDRRTYAPGQHGQNRFKKASDYSVQLREKQKVKHMYGMLERQFRKYFETADRIKGVTGMNLLSLLECRLDNVIYRFGFAGSRDQARQFIRHSHFQVNGKKVTIPSFQVKTGDIIGLKEKSRKNPLVIENLEGVARRGVPGWLELDKTNFQGKVRTMPVREDITMPINEHLIVELYSK